LHVFPYSARPGTAATRLGKAVPGDVVRQRARELRDEAARVGRAYRASRLGGSADVVVVRGDRREGLTEDYLSVAMEGTPLPRGARVAATLSGSSERLIARVC